MPVDHERAGGDVVKAGEKADDRALAGARLTDDRELFARPRQTQPMQDLDTRQVFEMDVAELDLSASHATSGLRPAFPSPLSSCRGSRRFAPGNGRALKVDQLLGGIADRVEKAVGREHEGDEEPDRQRTASEPRGRRPARVEIARRRPSTR